jgi:hypothetical protein
MNHNKYSSSCKKLKLKIVIKLKIKILLKQWGGVKCTQEYASKIFFGIGSQFVPYFLGQKFAHGLYLRD